MADKVLTVRTWKFMTNRLPPGSYLSLMFFIQEGLIRNGLDTKIEKSRKQLKERKNKSKKIRGVKKTKAGDAAKGGKKK
ncbi:hypothetical protein Dsin_009388 [Dipteronia sinensis]|uniref:Ribosomal protein S19 n=1 Tax=Dipteronia sinensis TaxID=43782 RepID=A0AAE0AQV1_9ROSI|nr:hypothetical protein Dsin_009388 [Dipteronia sinensis]